LAAVDEYNGHCSGLKSSGALAPFPHTSSSHGVQGHLYLYSRVNVRNNKIYSFGKYVYSIGVSGRAAVVGPTEDVMRVSFFQIKEMKLKLKNLALDVKL
jgi:hypothetical protein